tara:strand:+ start:467 stop:715 length:249 start_codon:yes stop_codon:yes gene_type:complete
MSNFRVTEVPFDLTDIKPTLEDEFTITSVTKELEKIKDPEKLRLAALNLLMITMQRQQIIRGLCKRLVANEAQGVETKTHLN